ncbi:MAG: hypothetical protein ACUVUC_16900 [Thermoguttaceae bacterium]
MATLILHSPAFVATVHHRSGGHFGGGQGCDPNPFAGWWALDAAAVPVAGGDGGGVEAAHPADLLRERVPGVEVVDVPALIGRGAYADGAMRAGTPEAADIVEPVAAFVFEHHPGLRAIPA